MKHPNFFLIGHPRSGTGTIDGYLKAHPQIYMGKKELHYFGSDLNFNHPQRSEQNFLSYFQNAPDNTPIIGESSTWYLASRNAAQEIYDFAPKAKILLSLRYPVDWLVSLHSHQFFAAYEDIPNFADALAAESDRQKGRRLPHNPRPHMSVMYRQLTHYTEQVQRYFDLFDEEQICVLIFDQLKNDLDGALDKIFDFLEVDRCSELRAQVSAAKNRNANHVPRSRRLMRWIKSYPRRAVLHDTMKAPFPGYRFALRALHKINTKTQERAPTPIELKQQLHHEFLPEIEQLEQSLGIDLNCWKNKF